MDLRTGRTYATLEEARAAGVPVEDLVEVFTDEHGQPNARSAQPAPKLKFTKGSFKPVESVTR